MTPGRYDRTDDYDSLRREYFGPGQSEREPGPLDADCGQDLED